MSSTQPPTASDLRNRLTGLTIRDQHRLRRRLDTLPRSPGPEDTTALARLAAETATAEGRIARRQAAVPQVRYPAELPVSQHRDEIAELIRDHQVVVIAGETGSGKTTQLPKICLELGRGVRGLIGHTQPRRIAARTVAERIATELDTEIGGAVGYQVRFTDQVGESSLVKVMTDGILLNEIQQDRLLRGYDTLIIDEAHERSLNIDFILGYLRQLLPKRPDLKVVITSATIDPQRFSRHFDDAPVLEVSGRTYPVEVRYRPLTLDGPVGAPGGAEERDQTQAICEAVDELAAEGPGDVLVFLSGEREIRDTADALDKHLNPRTRGSTRPSVEVLPLYARLSAAEQHRVFQPHTGRRVVLATNVAETSLTVPGIKYVVDPGTARISRYSHRTKVQRLPIEPISQASANQRKGRCGRVSEGICVRLYSEEDFASRPEFTDPEILRTNLASVILQMTAIGLGDIAAFPFVEPPDRRSVKDGLQLLAELGALDETAGDQRRRLTPLGRQLAQLPLDPRLGRMVIEADRNGCLREVLVLAAALSIQDPRERPVEAQQAADEAHRRFADPTSDFVAYLNLWGYLKEKQRELSSSQFRRMCRTEYLNWLRVREWQDVFSQLRQVATGLGFTLGSEPAPTDRVHQSLLAGLLSHIGLKDTDSHDYLGARSARFAVFPGSALFRKPPRWVMAAELVETSRLWARIGARIEPEWIEPLAGHLVKRNYSEPHWELKAGAVLALERVTLYGVPIVAGRKVNYGQIDPGLCRELFIRHALVDGEWRTHHKFFHHNRQLLAEAEELEHRARRRDIVVDDETLFDFYEQRIPAEIVSVRHFDTWWKKTSRTQPDLLTFDPAMLVSDAADAVTAEDYPDVWHADGLRFRLSYQFEPGADADGVTVHLPIAVLNQVSAEPFGWQVPGLRVDLVTALIRALPKAIRRGLVPAPDHARQVLARLVPEGDLLTVLASALGRQAGTAIDPADWQLEKVPDHLRITFRILDERNRTLAEGKDLAALKQRLRPKVRATLVAAAPELERTDLREWSLGQLPASVERTTAGQAVRAYPALSDEGETAAVRLYPTEAEAEQAMWAGTRRLLLIGLPSPVKYVTSTLDNQAKLALSSSPHGSVAALLADCTACAVDRLVAAAGGPVRDEAAFAALREKVRADLVEATLETVSLVRQTLAVAQGVDRKVRSVNSLTLLPSLNDIRAQLAALLHPGFVTAAGWTRLPDLLRYLRAIDRRLERLSDNPRRDLELLGRLEHVQREYREQLARIPAGRQPSPALLRVRWMIEELRVSFFAQQLGTAHPVSEKRIWQALDEAG